jgi:hypothetical protein
MNHNCETCAALWRDYSDATHAHFAIEAKLEVARLKHDQSAMQRLLPKALAAAEHRDQCRHQVKEHQQQAHGADGAGAAGGD